MENVKIEKNFILWIMGPTSSGKTTLAQSILAELRQNGVSAIHYDGDEVRDFFGSDFAFSESDRLRVVKTLVHLANKSFESGLNVIVSALTAHRSARNYVGENVNNLILTYLECSMKECIRRDPKGLYKRAGKGEIGSVIGVSGEYLPVKYPDILVKTEDVSVENSVRELVGYLREKYAVI
jgi:adenylylsulfate kinase